MKQECVKGGPNQVLSDHHQTIKSEVDTRFNNQEIISLNHRCHNISSPRKNQGRKNARRRQSIKKLQKDILQRRLLSLELSRASITCLISFKSIINIALSPSLWMVMFFAVFPHISHTLFQNNIKIPSFIVRKYT